MSTSAIANEPGRRSALRFGLAAAVAGLASPAIATAVVGADAELIRLCADLEWWDRQRQQRDRDCEAGHDHTDEELDAVLNPWWDAVDAIAETPARTPEGVLAKAAAVRSAFVGAYGDDSPQVIALLASLLTDMLGEPVRLPGAEDGDDA